MNKTIVTALSYFNRETLWLYGSRLSAVMLQSITLLIVAAIAGSEEFGQFSFMFSAARVMSVFVGLGGSPFLQRELAIRDVKYNGSGNLPIFITILLRMHLLSFLVLIFFEILILIFNFEYEILYILLTGYLLSFFDIYIAVVRVAKTASYSMILRDSFPYVFFLVGFLGCILIKEITAVSFIIVFCVSLFLCIAIALYVTFEYLQKRKDKFKTQIKNNMVLSFWGGTIVGASLAQSDILIAKYFLNEVELGAYAVLRRMTNLVSLPQVIVNWSINVDVAKSFATGKKSELQSLAIKGLYIAVPVSFIILISMFALSPVWLDLFDVNASFYLYFVFFVLAVAQLINVMSGANLLFALQCHEEKFVFKTRLLSLIVGLIAMSIGGYLFGMMGLAVGAATSIVMLNTLVTRHVKNRLGIWTSVPFLRLGSLH